MASSTIFGNFTVIDGTVVNAANNGRLTYALYNTSVYTADLQSAFPATLRCFLPPGMAPYPDNTTIFLYGKICAPTSQPFLIEALNMFPYPGDPSDANYGIVPAFAPRISILGHVSGGVEVTYEGRRIFRVMSASWVRDQLQVTNFMCAFSYEGVALLPTTVYRAFFENTIRWKKTNPPNTGSPVFISGPLIGRHDETHLPLLNIEDITFNAGSRLDQNNSKQHSAFIPKVHTPAKASWNNGNAKANNNEIIEAGSADLPISVSSGDSSDHTKNSAEGAPPVSSRTRGRVKEGNGPTVIVPHNTTDSEGPAASQSAAPRQVPVASQSTPPRQVPAYILPPGAALKALNIPNLSYPGPRFVSYGGQEPQAPHSVGSSSVTASHVNSHNVPPPYTVVDPRSRVAPQDTQLNNHSTANSNFEHSAFDAERDGPETTRQITQHIQTQSRIIEGAARELIPDTESVNGNHVAANQGKRQRSGNDVIYDSTDTAESITSTLTRSGSTRGRKRGRGSAKKSAPVGRPPKAPKRTRRVVQEEDEEVENILDNSEERSGSQGVITVLF
ncbi:hypothetical protein M422DRAFT_247382 [Sphaerobolus stellatus SS14]|uniref:Unplaced genomic scaffold SPHSTscaffold_575, whole genome shotgun sequence n=1 Tax=Sphaerobolus stellatus (strain SS14) TaxID=990650 RepID=A0A0C9UEA8_SPHS4|nr:hypothetical protein M422DRAFT_275888 [Sphaerobolus stellatus SS14]KIJ48534.1 hypothetical protein M422DRAFT_247382 [Sphaerobolus stellatus SS14]